MMGNTIKGSIVPGNEDIMKRKSHGSCDKPVQDNLRFNCDKNTADRICCFNRHLAEHSGYFKGTSWLDDIDPEVETTYFDSVSGKPLFIAPRGRSFSEFVKETKAHGWPSFREAEVVWDNVRVLSNGETVSIDGTHLGHNIPDGKGNRFCINLVSIAGQSDE